MLAGVITTGGIGLLRGADALPCVATIRAPRTTSATTTKTPLQSMSEPRAGPLEPCVLARVRERLASRLARRCCRADRRLVGGAVFLAGRPAGRLDVIPNSLCGTDQLSEWLVDCDLVRVG